MNKKPKAKVCSTKYCKRKTDNNRDMCSTCRSNQYRNINPLVSSYNNLKSNSKRRGILFNLSLEEFSEFCYETNYMQGKGKTKTSYSIDRIIEEKGYTKGNLQVLTLSNNTIKEHNRRKKLLMYDWQTKHATVMVVETSLNNSENPF